MVLLPLSGKGESLSPSDLVPRHLRGYSDRLHRASSRRGPWWAGWPWEQYLCRHASDPRKLLPLKVPFTQTLGTNHRLRWTITSAGFFWVLPFFLNELETPRACSSQVLFISHKSFPKTLIFLHFLVHNSCSSSTHILAHSCSLRVASEITFYFWHDIFLWSVYCRVSMSS